MMKIWFLVTWMKSGTQSIKRIDLTQNKIAFRTRAVLLSQIVKNSFWDQARAGRIRI